jgi:hypothetical protein
MRTYANSVVNKFATDTTGNAGAGALVTVYTAGSTVKAQLFDVLGAVITNPLSADDEGNYSFKVADGIYDLVINEGALSETKIDRLQIAEIVGFNADTAHYSDLAAAQAANLTVSTIITTAGYYVTNDGGEGQYIVVAGGTGPADGGSYINMLNGNQLNLIKQEVTTLESFGVSVSNTDTGNGVAYLNAIESCSSLITTRGPYSFEFSGQSVSPSHDVISIDLGMEVHIFKNFGGMIAGNLISFSFSGNLDCDNTNLVGIVEGNNLESVTINTIKISNVFITGVELFLFKWFHTVEKPFSLTCNEGIFNNFVNSSATVPMSVFGNYGSSSTLTTMHQMTFGNLSVNEFYSVDGAGNIIDGESDFFRLFNNPVTVNINNLEIINVAKRFLKSQEECIFTVDYCLATLDSRFIQSTNHIGTFEAQGVNQIKPSRLFIKAMHADFSAAQGTPLIYNASGFDHECNIENTNFSNVGLFSSTQNIKTKLTNWEGSGLVLNMPFSNVVVDRFIDSNLRRFSPGVGLITNFKIESSYGDPSNFLISKTDMYIGEINNWSNDNRLIEYTILDNIKINISSGTTAARPLRPKKGVQSRASNITIDNQAFVFGQIYIANPDGGGDVLIENFVSNIGDLAFFSGAVAGGWNVVINNCDGIVSGAGISSVLTATYA